MIRLTQVAAALAATVIAVAPIGLPTPAFAQGNQQWFVPGQGGGGARPPGAQQRPPAGARPPAARPPEPAPQQGAEQQENEPPPMQVQLPPMPDLPPVAKGTTPPTPVIGVFGFRDVLRASTAVQQLERTLGERRDKLNQDVQKEQTAWRELQQQLANQRATLSPEQIRAKERDLQERVTKAQRTFRDRTRVLQESYQYGAAQVERITGQILRQVAESRGMNLVLPREQVPLSTAEFDVTEAVVAQLNKVMTTVVIPPEGVALSTFAPALPAQVSPAAGSGSPAAIAPATATPR
jgi:Skp family chaperone for outer membrane proteins